MSQNSKSSIAVLNEIEKPKVQTKISDNKRLKKEKLLERLYVDTNLEGHTEKND